jgi:hypothetical protein
MICPTINNPASCEIRGFILFLHATVVNDDLVQSVDQKICERRRFTIPELAHDFPQISRSVLCRLLLQLGYAITFCAR